jgi:PIN domain nuclease of toxin-antitoxin system
MVVLIWGAATFGGAGLLLGPHKDPFDRMLIAQSQAENLPIISNDPVFDTYKLRRLWD